MSSIVRLRIVELTDRHNRTTLCPDQHLSHLRCLLLTRHIDMYYRHSISTPGNAGLET